MRQLACLSGAIERLHTIVHKRSRCASLLNNANSLRVGGSSGWRALWTVQTFVSITDEKNDTTQKGIGKVCSLVLVKDLSNLGGIHIRDQAEVVASPPALGVREDAVLVELGDGIKDLFQEATTLQVKVTFREVTKQECILFLLCGASLCGSARKLVEINVTAHLAALFPEVFDERSHVSIGILAQNDRSVMGGYIRDLLFEYLCLFHGACARLRSKMKVSMADSETNCDNVMDVFLE